MFLVAYLVCFLLLISPAWGARVNFFLNILHPVSQEVTLKIKQISVTQDDATYGLKYLPEKIRSTADFGQTFLGYLSTSKGYLKTLHIVFQSAFIGKKPLEFVSKKIDLPLDLRLNAQDSLSVFVFWDIKGSLKGQKIAPDLYVRRQQRPLRGETLYCTCEDADTLFAIRADINQIVASLGLPSSPKGVVANSSSDKLFVVSEEDRSLNVVQLSTFQIIDRFILPIVSSPRYLSLLPNSVAVVSDPQSDYVVLVNIISGNLLASKQLGYSPSEIYYDSSRNQIFVSSPADQTVYILNSSLDLLSKLKVGQRPRGLSIIEGRLYVADYATGMVDLYDTNTWSPVGHIRSGRGAIQVFSVGDRIYISNHREGTVSLLSVGQLSVAKKIRVGKGPYNMAACRRRGWLFVALQGEKAIAVIDTTSERLVGKIRLGCRPFGLAVAQ